MQDNKMYNRYYLTENNEIFINLFSLIKVTSGCVISKFTTEIGGFTTNTNWHFRQI